MVYQLETCCGCLSLHAGAKVYGFVNIALAIIYLTGTLVGDKGFVMFILSLIFGALQLVAAVLLLIGAYKETARLLLPWLLVTTIVILFGLVDAISAGGIPLIISTIIYFSFNIYGILIVYSYYQTISTSGGIV